MVGSRQVLMYTYVNPSIIVKSLKKMVKRSKKLLHQLLNLFSIFLKRFHISVQINIRAYSDLPAPNHSQYARISHVLI